MVGANLGRALAQDVDDHELEFEGARTERISKAEVLAGASAHLDFARARGENASAGGEAPPDAN